MFCKASVLKCPGLKKKKGSLTVLLAESYLFLTMKIFKSTLCLPTAGGGKKKKKTRKMVACWLKLEQSALKH